MCPPPDLRHHSFRFFHGVWIPPCPTLTTWCSLHSCGSQFHAFRYLRASQLVYECEREKKTKQNKTKRKLERESQGAFHLSKLTGQNIQVVLRLSLLIKTIQLDQSNRIINSMHEGDGFSAKKPFGKSRFYLLTDWSSNGPAGQYWKMESALSRTCLALIHTIWDITCYGPTLTFATMNWCRNVSSKKTLFTMPAIFARALGSMG